MKETIKNILNFKGKLPQRFVLVFMLITAVLNLFTMRICLSVALVYMVKPVNKTKTFLEGLNDLSNLPRTQNELVNDERFDWSQSSQGFILSSFYVGYCISHVPGGIIADHFGGKYTMFFGVASTTLMTFLTPGLTRLGGSIALKILRIIMGLGEGVTFPAMSVLLAKWTPPEERARIGSLVLSATQLGSVIGNALTGVLLHVWPWDYTFYFYGAFGLLWCIFWLLLCYSVPADHPFITEKELNHINETIKPRKKVKVVPYRRLASSLPVWALIIGEVGHDWGFYLIGSDLPKYLNDVLHLAIMTNGFLSALPALAVWLCTIPLGILADYLVIRKKCTVLNIRRYYTLAAAVIPACGLLIAPFVGSNPAIVMTSFTIGMAGMAGYYAGMRVNILDLTTNYAGLVMAVVNGIGAVAGVLAPSIVGILTPHTTNSEWQTVFIITFVILVVSGIAYFFMAQAHIQKWDLQGDEGATGTEEGEKTTEAAPKKG